MQIIAKSYASIITESQILAQSQAIAGILTITGAAYRRGCVHKKVTRQGDKVTR